MFYTLLTASWSYTYTNYTYTNTRIISWCSMSCLVTILPISVESFSTYVTNIFVQKWRSIPFYSSLLSTLGTLLVPAPFLQIQPSLRPSESSLFQYVSSMYSSSLACVTTTTSMSTTLHSLLPCYPTCFARGLFSASLQLNGLHSTDYGRLWSLPCTAFTYPRPSLFPTYRHLQHTYCSCSRVGWVACCIF